MKKIIFSLIVLGSSLLTTAQIQLQQSSIIGSSKAFITYTDTSASVIIELKDGEENVWDFTTLNEINPDTIAFKNPDWFGTRVSSAFPSATLAAKDGDEYSYFNVSDSAFTFIGNAEDTGAGPLAAFAISFDLAAYPLSVGDTISKAPILVFQTEDSLGLVPGPGAPRIDSIRVQAFSQMVFIGQSAGTINFPNNSVEKVLQINQMMISFPRAFAKIGNNWIEIDEDYAQALDIPFESDTTYNLLWWSTLEKSGVPLIQIEYENEGDTVNEVDFSNGVFRTVSLNKPEISIKAYPNPASNYIILEGVNFTSSKVEILDMAGRTIETKDLDSRNGLDLSDLKSGNYLLISNTTEGLMRVHILKK